MVGFARPEAREVTCIEVADEWDHRPYEDCTPCNWVPEKHRRQLSTAQLDEISSWEEKRQGQRRADYRPAQSKEDIDEISSNNER